MTKSPQDTMSAINTHFKKEVIKLGSSLGPVCHWPTGVLPMDVILDGGPPQGRFIDVYGDYSTLKSYMAYRWLGMVQALGGTAALNDAEHSADEPWMRACGVDTDSLLIMRPETGEEAIGVMEVLIRDGIDAIVWDSIAATQPQAYAETSPQDEKQPARLASMMSAGLRRLTSANRHTSVMCLNQTRINVGIMFGSKESGPGGRALPFYASYRIRMAKAGRKTEKATIWTGEKLERKDQIVKQTIRVTMEKNKLNAPVRETYFDFDLETGEVDELGYMVAWLLEQGYVTQSDKNWFTMDDLKVQGIDKFKAAMVEQPEVIEWVRDELTKDHLAASPGNPAPAKKKGGAPKRKS